MGEDKENFTKELGELLSKYEHFDVQSLSYEIDGSYDEVVEMTMENSVLKALYSTKWIKENLDYPTLLNNFIYLLKKLVFYVKISM